MKKTKLFKNPKFILITLLVVSFLLRVIRLDYPHTYVFDEVYHGYTAREYLAGNREAWSPWGKSPPGVAFEWLHPPIAKELMTISMFVFRTNDNWAYRFPGVLLNVLGIYLIYKVAKLLFKSELIALVSAFFFSIDGLVFVQSRTGMNDAHLVTFILVSLLFFIQKRYFWCALFVGVASATKWPGIFLLGMYLPLMLYLKQFKRIPYFILIPPIIYLLSYSPYFLIGYKWSDFVELHRQIWWYQTNLKATHDYSSPFWSWPLNLYPVWYFVEYHPDSTVSNIFASGNPLLFWFGFGAILVTIWDFIKTRSINLLILIWGYFLFLLPWAFTPRIMFFYHFSPSVPFLTLTLGYQVGMMIKEKRSKTLGLIILGLITLSFILIYPFLTGIPLPRNIMLLFFETNITKNPFI